MAQGLVLVLLGAAVLSTTVASDLYLNYVKDYFQPFLAASGVVLVVLGLLAIAAELRAMRAGEPVDTDEAGHEDVHHHDHGHGHSGVPRAAWLLLLPVAVVFVVSPPPLGSYTVTSSESSVPAADASAADGLELPADPNEPLELSMQQFVMHAWVDEERRLAGQLVRLTGFVVPADPEEVGEANADGWYLARLQMSCCAADAIVNKVLIIGEPAPEEDSWVTVEGRWVEPEGDLAEVRVHEFEVETLTEVDNPPDPYE